MNNAGTLFLILLGIIGIILLCVAMPVLQTIIAAGCGIGAVLLLILTINKIFRSMKLKEYFWQVIPDCDKDYLTFGFIRRSRHFQKERCKKILQCDPEKGRELLELESFILNSLYAIMILFLIARLFFRTGV